MADERQPRLPQFDTVESVIDLRTGEKFLRRRRRRRSQQPPTDWERSQAINQWWAQKGRQAFLQGAEGWRLQQSVKLAKDSNQDDVEAGSGEEVGRDAEENLRDTFSSVRFSPIRALDIVMKLKQEARTIESNLGPLANWLGGYLEWTTDILAQELKLAEKTKSNLKIYIHQPHLPGL